jgi:cytochrome c-type biogenesis protein
MGSGAEITYWIALTAGVLSFFSPCVLPLIPSYLTYITGLSFGQLQDAHPGARVRLTVFIHTLVFILGFSVVFVTLGAIAGVASAKFQLHLREGLIWVERVGGLLIILFGIHMTGLFHFGVLLGEKRVHLRSKPSGFIGTFIVGIAFAAGWTPCIGPILASILMVAASSGQAAKGVGLLSVYSLIRVVEIFTGVLLIAVGIMLMFNYMGILTMYLYQWFPIQG